MSNDQISINNLSKIYDNGFEALKKINLNIKKGEIFAMLGPNGAGKTTLISIICGIVRPSSGKVTVDDFIDSIINFDSSNEQCAEILFALKVKLFENDIVKNNTDKDTKSLLRSAKTPVEAIKLFDKLNG